MGPMLQHGLIQHPTDIPKATHVKIPEVISNGHYSGLQSAAPATNNICACHEI